MKITYTQNGDYLIPNIKIRKAKKSLGHYGRLRKAYLQQFRPILYNELILTEKQQFAFVFRLPVHHHSGKQKG